MTAGYGGGGADSALADIRPVVTRIDTPRSSEDLAADLIEIWSGLETVLRRMFGGSALSGQALVREVRQREMITLTQAHALLEFLAARERCDNVSYKPTPADVAAAKDAFAQLDTATGVPGRDAATAGAASAMAGAPAAATGYSSAQRAAAAPQEPAIVPPAPGLRPLMRERAAGLPTWGWIAIAVVALAFAGVAAYYAMQNRGDDMDKAVRMMADGRREAARGEFTRIARENPELATPHVFLARIAREEGDLAAARREIETAIRLDPAWSVAQREMGMLLLSQGNYDLARRFFVRAIELNPADSAAKGFLGCSLIRLGNRDLGLRFIGQAGTGSWSACAR
ncbi:MAG: tetratricopeptide repeat protein [Gemmatimonadaceae bacterium]